MLVYTNEYKPQIRTNINGNKTYFFRSEHVHVKHQVGSDLTICICCETPKVRYRFLPLPTKILNRSHDYERHHKGSIKQSHKPSVTPLPRCHSYVVADADEMEFSGDAIQHIKLFQQS